MAIDLSTKVIWQFGYRVSTSTWKIVAFLEARYNQYHRNIGFFLEAWNWSCWLQSFGRTKQSCLCSKKCDGLWWQVSLYRRKSNSRSLSRRRTTPFNFFESYAFDSRDLPQGPRESRSSADLIHARMIQLQQLRLAATVTSTLDKESEAQEFVEANKSEAWMDSLREELSSLINNQTCSLVDLSPGRTAICCDWIYKAKKNENGAVYRFNMLCPASWNRTFSATHRHSLFIWEPEKTYTWSNQRVLMMDQAECVYFKSVSIASNSREENGTFWSRISWNTLDTKSGQKNHA